MSIVLAIIGVIIGGGMSIFSASLQKRQLQETQFKMKAIQKALYDFRIINNRLPCPADVTLALNSTNFGVEGATPGSCIADGTYASDALTAATGPAADFANIITTTGNLLVSTIVINSIPSTAGISAGMGISGANIPAGTTVLSVLNGTTISISAMPTTTASGVTLTFGNNVEGMAPVASLHLPDDYALDGWGRRIMYTVDNRFTANGALIPYPNAITMIGNGVLANTMNTLPTTSGLSVGMRVYGPKMPQAETIASITSSTAITLTTAICCTATGYSFTFSTKPIPATAILVTDTTQRMTVNDQSGNPKTTRAAYVLVSFGANGHGAWPRNGAAIGSRISSGSNNPDELTNCNCSNWPLRTPPFRRARSCRSSLINMRGIWATPATISTISLPSARGRIWPLQGSKSASLLSIAFYPLAAFLSSLSLTSRCHSPSASCPRRRIRAVTGSSADARRFPVRCGAASMVCAALSVLIRSASSGTVGASPPCSGAAPERPILSWSRKAVNSDR